MLKKLSLALLFGAFASAANAFCFDSAAKKHGVDPVLLKAIATTESSLNPAALNKNTNGSRDYGLMQINSVHLPELRKKGITAEKLLADACTNVNVGAQILADNIRRVGSNWKAVGAYHSANPFLQRGYVSRVWNNYVALKEKA